MFFGGIADWESASEYLSKSLDVRLSLHPSVTLSCFTTNMILGSNFCERFSVLFRVLDLPFLQQLLTGTIFLSKNKTTNITKF